MRLVASPRSHPRLRLNVLRVIVFAALSVLLLRLWSLQVFEHGRYQVTAEGNRVREVVSQAPRGIIVDDQGKPLATNQTSLVITIDRSALDRQSDSGRAVIARLAAVLHTTPAVLNQQTRICTRTVGKPCWNGSPYQPIPVASNVAPEIALSVIEHPELFPGVAADTKAVRVYPQGSLAAHEIGYTGPASQSQLADKKLDLTGSDIVGQAGSRAVTTAICAARPGSRSWPSTATGGSPEPFRPPRRRPATPWCSRSIRACRACSSSRSPTS